MVPWAWEVFPESANGNMEIVSGLGSWAAFELETVASCGTAAGVILVWGVPEELLWDFLQHSDVPSAVSSEIVAFWCAIQDPIRAVKLEF